MLERQGGGPKQGSPLGSRHVNGSTRPFVRSLCRIAYPLNRPPHPERSRDGAAVFLPRIHPRRLGKETCLISTPTGPSWNRSTACAPAKSENGQVSST